MTRVVSAMALSAGLLVAGCSSKSEPSQPESTAPAAHGTLAECLKANGVQDPGGQSVILGPPTGVDPATWDKAMKACSSVAPGPAPGPGN